MSNLIISQSTFTRYFNQLNKADAIKDWRILASKFADMETFMQSKLSDLVALRIKWVPILKRYFAQNRKELKAQDLGTWAKFASQFFGVDDTQIKYYTRAAELCVNDIRTLEELSDNLKGAYKVNVETVTDKDGKVKRTEDGLRILTESESIETATDKASELEQELIKQNQLKVKLQNQLKKVEQRIKEIEAEMAS